MSSLLFCLKILYYHFSNVIVNTEKSWKVLAVAAYMFLCEILHDSNT